MQKLKAYYFHDAECEWGMGYLASSYKEAKQMFWDGWRLELDEWINIRGHQVKLTQPVPIIFNQKGEVDLLIGYFVGIYSYFCDYARCPICKTESVHIDSEVDSLYCTKCHNFITLDDLIKIEELKQLKGF